MTGAFRFHASEWLTGGLHLIILVFALEAEDPEAWPYALAAMSIVSFCAWIATYRRYRAIHDLPTSRVASAAQGYVELYGRSEPIDGKPILSKLAGLPCCWYRFYVERRDANNKWVHDSSGISHKHFLLVDDSGACVISPEGAEVLCTRKDVTLRGDYRYTEWLLLPQGRLYAIGEFSTVSGAVAELDERREVSELLAEWKKDEQQLRERFDSNRDGAIDLEEWEQARLQAQHEVRRRHAEARTGEGVHLMRKPRDGRLFLLADMVPEAIGRRFALWSWLHLAVFFGAGVVSLMLFL